MIPAPLGFKRAIGYLCGGLLVWAALFLWTYVFAAIACARGFSHLVWLGFTVVTLLLVASAVAALGGLHALARRIDALAVRSGRRSDDTQRLVADVAAIVCGLALIAIVWNTLPLLLHVRSC